MRLGAVAISVIIPLIRAAEDNGIIRRERAMPVFAAMVKAIGMKIATIPVELMNAPVRPTVSMSRVTRRVSLVPPTRINHSPTANATPVVTSASPTTKSPAIMITTDFENPARASGTLTISPSMRASRTRSATTSRRTRPLANRTTATPRTPNTNAISPVIGHPGHQSDPISPRAVMHIQ